MQTTVRAKLPDGRATRLLFAAWLATGLTALPACSDDTATATAPSPPGPPALSIEEPVEGACVPLVDTSPLSVRVRIATTNWLLRPPGVCGIYPQCGYAVVFVDDQRLVDSASLVTDVPFGQLAEPTGQHGIRVELHDDADAVALDALGEPLRVDRTITTSAPGSTTCP